MEVRRTWVVGWCEGGLVRCRVLVWRERGCVVLGDERVGGNGGVDLVEGGRFSSLGRIIET